MGEQLSVCACALVLAQLAGPLLVALALGARLPGFIYLETLGKESVLIATSVSLNASHPEHVNIEL